MLYRIVAAALIFLCTDAESQIYGRADIVRGLCRPDGCDEFSVLDKQPVIEADHGILIRTRVRTFLANSQGRKDLGEEEGYVFCSATTPAILSKQEGQTVAFLLAPFESPAKRDNTNFYTLYFSMCHGIEAGRAAAKDWRSVAASLN